MCHNSNGHNNFIFASTLIRDFENRNVEVLICNYQAIFEKFIDYQSYQTNQIFLKFYQ